MCRCYTRASGFSEAKEEGQRGVDTKQATSGGLRWRETRQQDSCRRHTVQRLEWREHLVFARTFCVPEGTEWRDRLFHADPFTGSWSVGRDWHLGIYFYPNIVVRDLRATDRLEYTFVVSQTLRTSVCLGFDCFLGSRYERKWEAIHTKTWMRFLSPFLTIISEERETRSPRDTTLTAVKEGECWCEVFAKDSLLFLYVVPNLLCKCVMSCFWTWNRVVRFVILSNHSMSDADALSEQHPPQLGTWCRHHWFLTLFPWSAGLQYNHQRKSCAK